jgi:two-component system cell cycle response regulator
MRIHASFGDSEPTAAGLPRDAGALVPVEVTPALTLLDGPGLGECYRLGPDQRAVVVGRGVEAHFVIPHPTVSRLHARLYVAPHGVVERVTLLDLGSRNGTFVNGEPVRSCSLEPGDKIHFGEVPLRFDHLDPVQAQFLDRVTARARQALVDPLTGLALRTAMGAEGQALLKRCQVKGDPFVALMADLDHFKQLNDAWGHPAGDEALQKSGAVILESVRGADLAIRYGGEEFLMLLAKAGEKDAVRVARRIAARLREIQLAGAPGVVVTASQGLALAKPAESLPELISRADTALLTAKRTGRDRIVIV